MSRSARTFRPVDLSYYERTMKWQPPTRKSMTSDEWAAYTLANWESTLPYNHPRNIRKRKLEARKRLADAKERQRQYKLAHAFGQWNFMFGPLFTDEEILARAPQMVKDGTFGISYNYRELPFRWIDRRRHSLLKAGEWEYGDPNEIEWRRRLALRRRGLI